MTDEKNTAPENPATDLNAEERPSPEAAQAAPAPPQATPPPAPDDFAAMFAASEPAHVDIQVGDVVAGEVVSIGKSSVFVTVGAKGEAEIDLAEFRDPATGECLLAVGDRVEATVVDDGRVSGSVVLKRSIGRGTHVPAELEQAMAHHLAVEGVVTGENKGGFDVQIGAVRAFCPGSQIDARRGERPPAGEYIGQRLRFHVMRIDAGGRDVVVSRRQLLEQENRQKAEETWKRLEVGAVVSGTVTSLREFGAFVDLGGVEGLIHITEMAYGRIGHPSDVVQVGQPVTAQVIKVEEPGQPGGRRQVGLSLRALAKDPWETAVAKFPVGSTVRGVVRRLENFGAFVELAPGLDGLVHVSKMVLDRRLSHPRQAVNPGDEVEVTVLAVDPAQRRLSLSMVEKARATRDSAEAIDRADEKSRIDEQNTPRSLGTFGDLLAASKDKRR